MEMLDGQLRDLDEGPGLLQSVWRYIWLIAIGALLGALLGYGWQVRQPTLYESSTRLVLSIGSSALPGDSEGPPQEPERFLSNQAAVIGSAPVLQRAAKATKGMASPESLWQRLTVEVAKDADVITIRVRDATPEGAARLATAVGTAYREFVIEQSREAAAGEVKQLDAVADDLSAQLRQLADALQTDGGNPVLQAKQRAVRGQLNATATRSERLAARARVGVSPIQLQEPATVSRQPVQPAPRRGATAGLLLGLVASAALAWWLNSRQATKQEVERQETDSVEPEPALKQETADAWMEATPANGNGARPGAVPPLLPELAQQHFNLNDVEDSGRGSRVRGGDMSAGDGAADLRSMFGRLEGIFGQESLDWYMDNVPQFMAEEATMTVYAEMTAILWDKDGSFTVAGGIGLTADELGATVDRSHEVLRRAVADGVGIFQDGTDRTPTAAAGIPGSQSTQALVMVPLVNGSSWLGMLLVGRRSANGHRVATFNDQELEDIIVYAMEVAPILQTLLLLDRLQGSVRSVEFSRRDNANLRPADGR